MLQQVVDSLSKRLAPDIVHRVAPPALRGRRQA
jgi:hypothetical protein